MSDTEDCVNPARNMVEWFSLRRLSASVRRNGQPKRPGKDPESQPDVPPIQKVLLLYEAKHDYQLVEDYPVPAIRAHEVLVQTKAIGLNPIDWKAP